MMEEPDSFEYVSVTDREDPDVLKPQKSPNELDQIFVRLEGEIMVFVKEQLQRLYRLLASENPDNTSEYPDSASAREEQSTETPDSTIQTEERQSSREAMLNIILNFLRRMDQEEIAQNLKNSTKVQVCRDKMKLHLRQKYGSVFEGMTNTGASTSVNQTYIDPCVTEGGISEVDHEHEVRHIETAPRTKPDTPLVCEDFFKQRPDTRESVRTVLTKGVAGIGKTVLTQKFSLDWAEGKTNQDFQLLFPFTFRELNLLQDSRFSLVELLHHYFNQTKDLSSFEDLNVLFILDGLDECRLSLDFRQTRVLTETTEKGSIEELLVNIIRGSLLPFAHIWVTTRPRAANQIPAKFVSLVTKLCGFTNSEKEQYFRKRINDKQQAKAVISHIKTNYSLHIMSNVPVICWILSTVLQHLMRTRDKGELPQTLTQMYIHFLVIQVKVKNVSHHEGSEKALNWSTKTRKMVLSLAKLAFEQLLRGNLVFYESDLNECGLDAKAASLYSAIFTQIFRQELGLDQRKAYYFIHLTVQEFLAALHVHQTFAESGVNLLEGQSKSSLTKAFKRRSTLSRFHRSAVDLALKSPNGHLDLFLRFLLGLSLPTNQNLLSGLLTPLEDDLTYKTVWYIKQQLDEGMSAERSLNLLHCLNELNDKGLVKQIQGIVREGGLRSLKSPAQWSAMSFFLLSSDVEEFDLRRYHSSEKALLKLLPVIKASNKATLSGCGLSSRSCRPLASILSSSNLSKLDLSNNLLQDSGVELLCDGMKSAAWRLRTVSLSSCGLSPLSCEPLASVLSSSALTHLDLSYNDLEDTGVELLCEGLKCALCRLNTLRMSGCLVSERGGCSLASALRLPSSPLRELDLRYNHPGPSAELLTELQDDPQCPLEVLRLEPGGERFMVPGLRKYFCEFCLDENTAHCSLVLSEHKRGVVHVRKEQRYPDHEDRFRDRPQVLGSTGLSGRCYWEVSWMKRSSERSERISIAVSYRRIKRSADSLESHFGENGLSWSLRFIDGKFYVCHKGRETPLSQHCSRRVGVFLDTEAGVLSFYQVLADGRLSHLHTINTAFTEPLFPGLEPGPDMTVTLTSLKTLLNEGNMEGPEAAEK